MSWCSTTCTSAYTSDGTIATEQLALLLADMQAEYEKGSWCVAGGDFNKDLLGDSSVYFGAAEQEYSWAQPIPEGVFDSYDVQLVAPLDENDPVPSCRNADGPYHDGQYVLTVDGFLVTPNVAVDSAAVLDTGFAYSDHNPVQMTFTLQSKKKHPVTGCFFHRKAGRRAPIHKKFRKGVAKMSVMW